jgi:hypothetical protein
VSRQRRLRRIQWTDEAGHAYEDRQRQPIPASLGRIPRRSRLLYLHDRAGHLVAVLTRGGAAPHPLLYVHRWPQLEVLPSAALTEDGLVGVMIVGDTAGLLGAPVPEWPAPCLDCGNTRPVSAAVLRAAMNGTHGRAQWLIVD